MQKLILITLSLLFLSSAYGANRPASRCEIFIRKVGAAPSSHGSASMPVIVKVGWIGGGEFIRKVGFYGYSVNRDLGNLPSCHMSPLPGSGQWKVIDPFPGGYGATEYGDYAFSFPIRSGSVVSGCPGYEYTWVGAFFVETDRNTYWVNPQMNPNQHFYFDPNGYRILEAKAGSFFLLPTDRLDMRYYNPLACR